MLSHLIRSKGPLNIIRRGAAITERVGVTPRRMAELLQAFAGLLARYDAPATFPVPALTLARNPRTLHDLLGGPARIELAVHGYRHIDLSLIAPPAQAEQLRQAQACFRRTGTPCAGFRAPYLRWNPALLTNLAAAGFAYDSSRSALWPVLDLAALSPAQAAKTKILLDFCRPADAAASPVLPATADGLVHLPVSFPDDELLVERLGLTQPAQQAALWLKVFELSHALGELFVLQLHPERFYLCADALEAVLARAVASRPPVWLATLGEIAAWWRQRPDCRITLTPAGDRAWHVHAAGPDRAVLQVRGSAAGAPFTPAAAHDFTLEAQACPGIGVAPDAPPALAAWLAEQGYPTRITDQPAECAVFLSQKTFSPEDQRAVCAQIEASAGPLVRFARWPHAAQSALAVTGDIDSLTVWDYALRLAGA